MDIHHISTGRGNAAFWIFPDGTTMLVDAGEISDTHPRTRSLRNSALRPDSSRTAAEWIVYYIRRFHPEKLAGQLDYAVITHFHDDHFGEWDSTRALALNGAYRRTGIITVGDDIRINRLLDRGLYFPIDVTNERFRQRFADDEYHIVQTLDEYRKFIAWQSLYSALKHDSIRPGARNQIVLTKNPAKFPNWQVRNIAASGRIWTGYADDDYTTTYPAGAYPGENPLSVCLKISYGPFDYFLGGDISGVNDMGEGDLYSMEALVAPVIGPVDIASLNHHGNRDSHSPFYVRSLRPRVWVQQCWSSDHPGEEVLRRITSPKLYPGERDVFTTDMLEANRLVIGEKIDRTYKNRHGHVVVRVMPGGETYMVYILDDYAQKPLIMASYGPYFSR